MRLFPTFVTSLALGFASLPALAQDVPPPPGGGGGAGAPPGAGGQGRGRGEGGGRMMGPQLSPEQLAAVYEAQAKVVAHDAGLSEGEASQVITAYAAARESHTKALADALAKAREERRDSGAGGGAGGGGDQGAGGEGNAGGGRRGAMQEEMQKVMADVNKAERTKFESALNGFLKPEQVARVVASLGNFDRGWDQTTHALVELKLEPETMQKAMSISQAFSAANIKARENTDREASRDAMIEARRTMMEEMKAALTEEQYSKFQRAVGGAGRGAGGPGTGAEGAPRRRPPAGGEGGAGGNGGGASGGAGSNDGPAGGGGR